MSGAPDGFAAMFEAIVRRVVREELATFGKATTGLVSVKTYADARSISASTVRAAIREGRLEASKIGGSVRIAASAEIGAVASTKKIDTKPEQHARKLGLVGGAK